MEKLKGNDHLFADAGKKVSDDKDWFDPMTTRAQREKISEYFHRKAYTSCGRSLTEEQESR